MPIPIQHQLATGQNSLGKFQLEISLGTTLKESMTSTSPSKAFDGSNSSAPKERTEEANLTVQENLVKFLHKIINPQTDKI